MVKKQKLKVQTPLVGNGERKAFFERMTRITGFPLLKMAEILAGVYGEGNFQVGMIPEYEKTLREALADERTKEALERKKDKLRKQIAQVPEPVLCGVPDCEGVRVVPPRGQRYAWICSTGGLHHFFIVAGAERYNVPVGDYQELYEKIGG